MRRTGVWRILVVLGMVITGSVLPAAMPAEATHFRASQINWSPVSGNTVEFTIQNAWRRNGYSCLNVTVTPIAGKPCTGPSGLAGPGDVFQEFIGATTFNFGDGSPPLGSPVGPLLYSVTSIDPANNWLFAEALDPSALPAIVTSIRHTYPAAGNFTARIDSCCRISSVVGPNAHINNPDGNYRVETTVNVGTTNHSPVSALPPIVNCPQNGLCSFQIPGVDPDGDALRFRLSTALEAGTGSFTQPGPPFAPNAAAVSTSGAYTWNTTGATLGGAGLNTLYSTQVVIEDLDAAGNPKSKMAVDFFLQLVANLGPAPIFQNPPNSPGCGSTINASIGVPLSFSVATSHPDPNHKVILNAVGLPLNATMSPQLPLTGNPVSSQFSWTPSANQVGTFVVTFTATDLSGQALGQQGLCSIIVAAKKETRGVIFVHGIHADQRQPGFPNLLSPLAASHVGRMQTFLYYDDVGNRNPTTNACLSPRPVQAFTKLNGFPITVLPTGTCDSQDGVGLNAILLDQDIQAFKANRGVDHVTIVSHSMGAAVTRAFLAYATATQSPSLDIVDSIVFMQGAQEGSFWGKLDEMGQSATGWRRPIVQAALGAVRLGVKTFVGIDDKRPAIADLTPQSPMYRFVNQPQNVPNSIRFANFASDIAIHTQVQVFPFTFNGPTFSGNSGLGDYVMRTGEDSPAALPQFGGARFDPSVIGRGKPNPVQRIMNGDATIRFKGDLSGNYSVDASDVLNAPMSHFRFGDNIQTIQVDAPGGGKKPVNRVILDWVAALDGANP